MIRPGDMDDIRTVTDMTRAMVGESPYYRDVPFFSSDFTEFLWGVLEKHEQYCFFISETGGRAKGFFIGLIAPFVFNKRQNYSVDVGLYVRPEARGASHANRLVKAYEGWAASKGIASEHVRLGVTTTNDDRIHNFYMSMGYDPVGTLYRKGA